jgi:hypothetical protein
MVRTEFNRVAVAVAMVFTGARFPSSRLCRVRVLFPDIGAPGVIDLGFLRYQGERSFVVPEATDEQLQLPEGLTVNL